MTINKPVWLQYGSNAARLAPAGTFTLLLTVVIMELASPTYFEIPVFLLA